MKLKKLITLFGICSILAGCGKSEEASSPIPSSPIEQSSSSSIGQSSSTSSDARSKDDYSSVLNMVYNLVASEANISSEKIVKTSNNAYSKTVQTFNVDIYSDDTSSSEGTIIKYDANNKETLRDTFKERTLVRTDKVANETDSYDEMAFIYYAIDYDNNNFSSSLYGDDASRLYVAGSASDAASKGFDDDSYVLQSEIGRAITKQGVFAIYTFIQENLINDTYIGSGYFYYGDDEDGNVLYETTASYSYPDTDYDGTITIEKSVSFVWDEDNDRILSYKTSYLMTEVTDDSDDPYISESIEEGTLNYGQKEAAPSDGLLNVDDYFVTEVTELDVTDDQTAKEFDDPAAFPVSADYLFAKPKTYLPAKALNVGFSDLTPVSSSDSSVIKLNNGYFECVGKGSTTLTYSYVGKESDIWVDKQISIDIVIPNATAPQSISAYPLFTNSSPTSYNNQIHVGKSYKKIISVSPFGADKRFTATVSDSSILSATPDIEDGSVTLTGLKEGTVQVTYASVLNPKVKCTETYQVFNPMTADEAISYVKGKTFQYYNSLYDYTITMTLGDGTGTFTGRGITVSFSWMATEGQINLYDYDPSDDDGYADEYGYDKTGWLTADGHIVFERPNWYDEHEFSPVEVEE